MQSTLARNTFGPSESSANPFFNVLIAYEDFETGKHAKRVCDFLAESLGQECQLTTQMWKFDVLSIPKLREIAKKDAVEADLVFLACQGEHALPVGVRGWLESWIMTKTNVSALVGLFALPPEQTQEVRAYLQDVCRAAGIEFFAQPDDWPGKPGKENILSFGRQTRISRFSPADPANLLPLDISYPRWGINE